MSPIERLTHAIAAWWNKAPRCGECGVEIEKGYAFCSEAHADEYNHRHAW